MRHLFSNWQFIRDAIKKASRVLILSDYDGTLTPIVKTPELARLSPKTRFFLKALGSRPTFIIGIISGRGLRDINRLVGLNNIYYAGNHGLELRGPKANFIYPATVAYSQTIHHLAQQLEKALREIPGILVEDKGSTLSFHYRLVKPKYLRKVKGVFNEIAQPLLIRGKIRLTHGKKVLEVRPPIDWDKGKAAFWIMESLRQGKAREKERPLPIYIGDDKTDEDAFRAINKVEGLSICVGRPRRFSFARYFVRSPLEVQKFLQRLMQI